MGFNLGDLNFSAYSDLSNQFNTYGPTQSGIRSKPTSMIMPNMSDAVPISESLGITFNNLPNSSPINTDTRIVPEEYGLEPPDYGKSELMESDTTSEKNLLERILEFAPFIGEKSLTGILTNALGGAKDKLTGFRDAIGTRLGPASYGTSQAAFNAMTPSQQQAVGSIYGPGGIMQGYNAVSAFGRGPAGAIQNRIDNILGRKAAQTAISRQRVKDLQAALTNVGGGDSGGGGGYSQSAVDAGVQAAEDDR